MIMVTATYSDGMAAREMCRNVSQAISVTEYFADDDHAKLSELHWEVIDDDALGS